MEWDQGFCFHGIPQILVIVARHLNFKLSRIQSMSNIKKAVFGALMTITLLGGAVSASAQPVCKPQHPGQQCEIDEKLGTCICG
ncbi:protein of unknown function (plasmid) [Cupriavidus taiwanensis]|uniref:Uncharacterized protein n=2 Tax=Cupriavidus taiwanensis TaxID=164546 RepID=A0A375IX90_9BURK|nr:hypothetical protein [Cupriavidus taiwanensis]SPK77765.1 protein of unknown function [Cupriavidus taiwanensis]